MEDSDIKSALCQTTKLKLFHLFNICIYKRYTRNRTHRGSNSEICPRANRRGKLKRSNLETTTIPTYSLYNSDLSSKQSPLR